MSQIKITNSIFNICLGDARGKTQKKQAILITDSTGFSLQQVSTEKFIIETVGVCRSFSKSREKMADPGQDPNT
jgi:ornithine cyclodeaminase/alanine dehydrogenase-like protein (mu-crystallin family)